MAVKTFRDRLLRHRWQRFLLCVFTMVLLVRLLPFSVPIRAADIAQTQLAVEFSDRKGSNPGLVRPYFLPFVQAEDGPEACDIGDCIRPGV